MTWMATPCGRISGTMPRLGMHGVAILDFGWMLDGCFGFWIHPMEAFFQSHKWKVEQQLGFWKTGPNSYFFTLLSTQATTVRFTP